MADSEAYYQSTVWTSVLVENHNEFIQLRIICSATRLLGFLGAVQEVFDGLRKEWKV